MAGILAYLLWGLFPLYWPLLAPAAPVEILAHRVLWSVVVVAMILAVARGNGWIKSLGGRRLGLLTIAAALISVNWGTFIYGVNSGRVVETSLGYFINPLVTVALAVIVLGERLRRAQAIAVSIAAIAVVILAFDYGHMPWIALTLAFSFGLYGLVRKHVGLDGIRSLAVEAAVLLPFAVVYLAWLSATGASTFGREGLAHAALLAGAGITTAVPLMLFGAAAIRISLTTLGLLQYLAPTLQFLIGVFFYGEALPGSRLAGFALVWLALVIFTLDALKLPSRQLPARVRTFAKNG